MTAFACPLDEPDSTIASATDRSGGAQTAAHTASSAHPSDDDQAPAHMLRAFVMRAFDENFADLAGQRGITIRAKIARADSTQEIYYDHHGTDPSFWDYLEDSRQKAARRALANARRIKDDVVATVNRARQVRDAAIERGDYVGAAFAAPSALVIEAVEGVITNLADIRAAFEEAYEATSTLERLHAVGKAAVHAAELVVGASEGVGLARTGMRAIGGGAGPGAGAAALVGSGARGAGGPAMAGAAIASDAAATGTLSTTGIALAVAGLSVRGPKGTAGGLRFDFRPARPAGELALELIESGATEDRIRKRLRKEARQHAQHATAELRRQLIEDARLKGHTRLDPEAQARLNAAIFKATDDYYEQFRSAAGARGFGARQGDAPASQADAADRAKRAGTVKPVAGRLPGNYRHAGKVFEGKDVTNPEIHAKGIEIIDAHGGIRFTDDGFPELEPFTYEAPGVRGDVTIELTGSRDKDFRLADKAAGFTKRTSAQGITPGTTTTRKDA